MRYARQSDAINARIFITTLSGRAQEWFTSPLLVQVSYEQTGEEIPLSFRQKKAKRSTRSSSLFGGGGRAVRDFINRFNNEVLEVDELRIDMMIDIMIHARKRDHSRRLWPETPGMQDQARRSRSRSPERNKQGLDKGKRPADQTPPHGQDNLPQKGVIHVIVGGPTNGDSQRARKRYARAY
ncbi:hypothetical protein DH2020_008466 [Rehmannia glutinosa]|uniref:Retrotransposon gag domain-containing protein n=1 Tax=Rehmannia glutinosa TaxID=99300 RepID=A0ABR0X4J8_REHGL